MMVRNEMHQVHPLTIAYEVLIWLRQMAFPLAVFVVLFARGERNDGSNFELAVGALAGFRVLLAGVNYLVSRWGFEGETFRWKTGVVFKQDRQIPLAKIQNVEIVRNLAHRLLGLAELKIDTGVGGDAEVRLSSLSVDQAQRLQSDLLHHRAAGVDPATPAARPEAFWRASTLDLALAGFTENRALAIVGTVFGLFTFTQFGSNPLEDYARAQLQSAGRQWAPQGFWVFGMAFLALMLVGWLLGMASTVIKFHGFEIVQRDGRLVREYGLFTRLTSAIIVRRVQTLVFQSTWMKRRFGFWEAKCTTAGGIQIETESAAATDLLCPVVPSDDMGKFARLIYPHLGFEYIPWRRVSPLTIRRHAVAYFIAWCVPVAIVGLNQWTWLAAWGLIPAAGFAYWAAAVRYAWVGYARVGEFLLVRTGVARRKIFVIPVSKIQVVLSQQSPFQRRAGLANLTVLSAGTMFGAPEIEDLPETEAAALFDELRASASAAGVWQLDGV